MKIGIIFLWLFIFILGSLVVNFIIEPSSFHKVKNNIINLANTIPKEGNSLMDYSELVKLQPNLYCSDIKYLASESGQNIKQFMERGCKYLCDYAEKYDKSTNGTYATSTCEDGKLICYCFPLTK